MLAEKRRFLQLFLGRRTLTAGDSIFLGCALFCLALLLASLVVQLSHEAASDASLAASSLDPPASNPLSAATAAAAASKQQHTSSAVATSSDPSAGVVRREGHPTKTGLGTKGGHVGQVSGAPGTKPEAHHPPQHQPQHHPQHHPQHQPQHHPQHRHQHPKQHPNQHQQHPHGLHTEHDGHIDHAKMQVIEERHHIDKESQLLHKVEAQMKGDQKELKQLKTMVSQEERLLASQKPMSTAAKQELLRTEVRVGKLMSKEQQDLDKLKQNVEKEHGKEADAEKAVGKWDEVANEFGASENIGKKHQKEVKKYHKSQKEAKRVYGKLQKVENDSEEVMTMHKAIALQLEQLHLEKQLKELQPGQHEQGSGHPKSTKHEGPRAKHKLGLRAR